MGDKTGIEWTDATWNPIRARYWQIQNDGGGKERIGWHCEHVSEGCRNCYAERINRRLGTGLDFHPENLFRPEWVGYRNGESKLFLDERMLTQPLRWHRSRMVFPGSMTDLFGQFVPDEIIDQVFAVMALARRHTFQVLTKRHDRMRKYMHRAAGRLADAIERLRTDRRAVGPLPHLAPGERWWPLPNVWLGVSVEDQRSADERIPLLLDTPAAVRFISAEPLLGPVMLWHPGIAAAAGAAADHAAINWVICGGESGPGARPMHPDWARELRDDCELNDVPFLFKQWGEWAPADALDSIDLPKHLPSDHRHMNFRGVCEARDANALLNRVGKKHAGRLLDGRTWDQYPELALAA